MDFIVGRRFFNQQQDVTDAVQVMRQRAQGAGQSEDHAAADRNESGLDDCHSACQP